MSIKTKLCMKRSLGFTLTELLITILIISMLSLAIVTGISAAGRAQYAIVTNSEASVLCGTLATELADELRFAADVTGDGENFTFTSRRHGMLVTVNDANGRITIGGNAILSEPAYSGLLARANVSYAPATGTFDVTVSVSETDDHVVAEKSFSVAVLS